MAAKTDVAALPKIIRFIALHDAGPSDGGKGNDVCPHCGADGRYVWEFECDDGTRRGAMRGCVKLFPTSRTALEDQRLIEKEQELRRSYGPQAKLNSWDTKIRTALDEYFAGRMPEAEALRTIEREKAAAAAWRSRKFGGR